MSIGKTGLLFSDNQFALPLCIQAFGQPPVRGYNGCIIHICRILRNNDLWQILFNYGLDGILNVGEGLCALP
jgi:hypothetical protein